MTHHNAYANYPETYRPPTIPTTHRPILRRAALTGLMVVLLMLAGVIALAIVDTATRPVPAGPSTSTPAPPPAPAPVAPAVGPPVRVALPITAQETP